MEEPIGDESGPGPVPMAFNARFATTLSLTTTLEVIEPDYAGFFGAATLRDGTLFTPDGKPDVGVSSIPSGTVMCWCPRFLRAMGGPRNDHDYFVIL